MDDTPDDYDIPLSTSTLYTVPEGTLLSFQASFKTPFNRSLDIDLFSSASTAKGKLLS